MLTNVIITEIKDKINESKRKVYKYLNKLFQGHSSYFITVFIFDNI